MLFSTILKFIYILSVSLGEGFGTTQSSTVTLPIDSAADNS